MKGTEELTIAPPEDNDQPCVLTFEERVVPGGRVLTVEGRALRDEGAATLEAVGRALGTEIELALARAPRAVTERTLSVVATARLTNLVDGAGAGDEPVLPIVPTTAELVAAELPPSVPRISRAATLSYLGLRYSDRRRVMVAALGAADAVYLPGENTLTGDRRLINLVRERGLEQAFLLALEAVAVGVDL